MSLIGFDQLRYERDRLNMATKRSTCLGYSRHTYDLSVSAQSKSSEREGRSDGVGKQAIAPIFY